MPILLVIAYRDETSAAAAGEQVQRLVRYLRIEPDAVAVVRRGRDGRFHLATNHRPVAGELSWGLVWMLVFVLLLGRPAGARLDPLLELVAGSGLDGRFGAEIRDRLDPGTSALFLALEDDQLDRVVDVLGPYGGEVLPTTVTAAQVAALRETLHGAGTAAPALSADRDPAPGSG
jgi:uncharacterized membrane protein